MQLNSPLSSALTDFWRNFFHHELGLLNYFMSLTFLDKTQNGSVLQQNGSVLTQKRVTSKRKGVTSNAKRVSSTTTRVSSNTKRVMSLTFLDTCKFFIEIFFIMSWDF